MHAAFLVMRTDEVETLMECPQSGMLQLRLIGLYPLGRVQPTALSTPSEHVLTIVVDSTTGDFAWVDHCDFNFIFNSCVPARTPGRITPIVIHFVILFVSIEYLYSIYIYIISIVCIVSIVSLWYLYIVSNMYIVSIEYLYSIYIYIVSSMYSFYSISITLCELSSRWFLPGVFTAITVPDPSSMRPGGMVTMHARAHRRREVAGKFKLTP